MLTTGKQNRLTNTLVTKPTVVIEYNQGKERNRLCWPITMRQYAKLYYNIDILFIN